jgi:hypothetical protein
MIGIATTCIALFAVFARVISKDAPASDDSQRVFKHPLTDMPPAAKDFESAYYFPSFPDQKFPIGQNVISLCHLSNQGWIQSPCAAF